MAKTQQQRLIEALTANGIATVIPGKSRKYITMRDRDGEGFYYIGKAGSIRMGRTFSDSTPILPQLKQKLLRFSVRADAVALSIK